MHLMKTPCDRSGVRCVQNVLPVFLQGRYPSIRARDLSGRRGLSIQFAGALPRPIHCKIKGNGTRCVTLSMATVVGPKALKSRGQPCRTRAVEVGALEAVTEGSTETPVDFDLSLAVSLAAAAFESYLEPIGCNGLQERGRGGIQTTYTDRSFLQEHFSGVLKVDLRRAEGLKVADLLGKSDPYVILSCGDSAGESQVVWNNLDPEWNETFYLYVRDVDKDMLRLGVYDKDLVPLKSDDDLGHAAVPLGVLLEEGGEEGVVRNWRLELRGGTGHLYLSTQFLPFTDDEGNVADEFLATEVENRQTATSSLEADADAISSVLSEVSAMEAMVDMAEGVQQQLEKVATDQGQPFRSAAVSVKVDQLSLLDSARQRVIENIRGTQQTLTDMASEQLQQLGRQVAEQQKTGEQAEAKRQEATGLVEQLKSSTFGSLSVEQLSTILSSIMKLGGADEVNEDGGPTSDTTTTDLGDQLDASILPTAWKVLAKQASCRLEGGYPAVAFVENTETDTQVWLYRNVEMREVVVAFRGTEQVKWKDILTDLNLIPISLNPERVTELSGLALAGRMMMGAITKDEDEEMMVHQGFLKAYDSVKAKVFSLVDFITNDGGQAPWTVLITGHSLGGALATLAAYELATRRSPLRRRQILRVYTYGAPRVGNRVFAKSYNRAVPDSWRVANSRDIVSSVPRLMGYMHVDHSVKVTSDGGLVYPRDLKEKAVEFEGRTHWEVLSDIAESALAGGEALDEVYNEILEVELALLDTLKDGSALEQHMETFYLQTLKNCVLAANPDLKIELDRAMRDLQKDTAKGE